MPDSGRWKKRASEAGEVDGWMDGWMDAREATGNGGARSRPPTDLRGDER
jgi:hypothetical protein